MNLRKPNRPGTQPNHEEQTTARGTTRTPPALL